MGSHVAQILAFADICVSVELIKQNVQTKERPVSVRRACRRIAEFPDAALALAGFSFGRFACKAQSLVGLYWDPPFDDRLAPGGSVLRPAKVNSQWLFQMRRSQRDGLFAL